MTFFKKTLEIHSKEGVLHFTRWAIFQCKYFSLYLHRINQADKDKYLHSHPWNFISIILKGSYEEECKIRRCSFSSRTPNKFINMSINRIKKFLTVSKMSRDEFHKVKTILRGPVYSLFFSYGKHMAWFYDVNGTKIESDIYRQMKKEGKLEGTEEFKYDYK